MIGLGDGPRRRFFSNDGYLLRPLGSGSASGEFGGILIDGPDLRSWACPDGITTIAKYNNLKQKHQFER